MIWVNRSVKMDGMMVTQFREKCGGQTLRITAEIAQFDIIE